MWININHGSDGLFSSFYFCALKILWHIDWVSLGLYQPWPTYYVASTHAVFHYAVARQIHLIFFLEKWVLLGLRAKVSNSLFFILWTAFVINSCLHLPTGHTEQATLMMEDSLTAWGKLLLTPSSSIFIILILITIIYIIMPSLSTSSPHLRHHHCFLNHHQLIFDKWWV